MRFVNIFSGARWVFNFSLRLYTLVELIVVCAIILILLSLLLTVLESAKGIVKDTACMENLSNIGALSYAYSSDNRGFFPRQTPDDNGDLTVSWDDNFSDYDGRYLSEIDKSSSFFYYDSEQDPEYESLGKSYAEVDHSMYKCPLDEPPLTEYPGVNSAPLHPRRIRRSYNPNSSSNGGVFTGISRSGESCSIASVDDPCGTIAFGEQPNRFNGIGLGGKVASGDNIKNTGCNESTGIKTPSLIFTNYVNRPKRAEPALKNGGGVLFFHGSTEYTSNYLFCDGRVEMLESKETVNVPEDVWNIVPGQANGMWTTKAGD